MARLVFGADPRPVPSSCLVGRSRRCDLRLPDPNVSSEHARLTWTHAGWTLQDLGSRNGTYVDGRRLRPGDREVLSAGAKLGFGQVETCVLASTEPPGALAQRHSDGQVIHEEGGWIQLAEDPPVSVIRDRYGGWVLDRNGDTAPVADLDEVAVEGDSWRLHLPEVALDTVSALTEAAKAARGLAQVTLEFHVTRDEEHVQLYAVEGTMRTDLGALAHNYLLLTLARLREEDAANPERSASEHGWVGVDRLLKMLRVDENKLNVDVHRARKRVASIGVDGAAGVVERRPTKQMRLGPVRVAIHTI